MKWDMKASLYLLSWNGSGYRLRDCLPSDIALANTSFKSESRLTSALLPFSSEVYQDLRNCFRVLEGVKCEQSSCCTWFITNHFSGSWTVFYSLKDSVWNRRKYEGINKEALANAIEKLKDLFIPLVIWEVRIISGGRFPHLGNDVADAFLNAVTLRLRMLGSRQQFEFKLGGTTETSICCEPALYSHVGTDGFYLTSRSFGRNAIYGTLQRMAKLCTEMMWKESEGPLVDGKSTHFVTTSPWLL